jgi:SAM-dependent methyltransferase
MTGPSMSSDEGARVPVAAARDADPALAKILRRYFDGEISAPVTLMQLLIETEDADAVAGAVGAAARDTKSAPRNSITQRRARDLEQLMKANSAGCRRIAAMLRADVDSAKPARSAEEGIAFCERLFDWSVQQSEEASVALYSLGNPELLQRATDEIVAQLRAWGLVTANTELLDIGCGIGRLLVALAPYVRSATGIDVSAEMVKAAQRRCAGLNNVTVIKGDGHGLTGLADASFDVAIAVDSFPYLRQSGYALVERFVADAARVLKPRGELVILNYSYAEDGDAAANELRALAAQSGFEVVEFGTRPFEIWDGVAFRLRLRTASQQIIPNC